MRAFSVGLLFILTQSFIYGQIQLSSEKKEWKIAIGSFQPDSVDSLLTSTGLTLSKLIYNDLSQISIHHVNAAEKIRIGADTIKKSEHEYLEQLHQLHTNRDAYLFNLENDKSKLKSLLDDIDAKREALSAVQALVPTDIVVADTLEVVFPISSNGNAIWNFSTHTLEIVGESEQLDMVLSGSIVRVGDYYGIGAYAWVDREMHVLWEGATEEVNLNKIAVEIAGAARTFVLGRPWTSLAVTVDPPTASISVNGIQKGVGNWTNAFIEPGIVNIELNVEGYIPKVHKLSLIAGEHRDVTFELKQAATPQALIRSNPSGADVRIGALWLGRTPLAISRPDRVMPLTVSKDGYKQRKIPFAPDTRGFTVPLEKLEESPEKELQILQKKLYNSIAWFSLSLAPTMVLLGLRENYSWMRLGSTNVSDFQFAQNAYSITNGVMWGSIALDIGLLAVVIVRLSQYLKTIEELSER